MGVFMTDLVALPRASVVIASLLALGLAGCQGSRLASLNTAPRAPAPLAAAPAGTVTASQLPPPASAGATSASAFPDAPMSPDGTTPQTEEDLQLAAANAPDVTAGSVAGVWNASVAGQGCRVATPQTKFGQGFRAGPLRCPAPLDGVKSWNVSGKQLALYDEGGNVLARLYASGAGKFDGQTSTGQPVSLSR
jgi:hypothetical protein